MLIIKSLRNHWKKTAFAAGALSYGISYFRTKYETHQIIRVYCKEAVQYGDSSANILTPPRRILVILNPAANKNSAEKIFQKYCEPILHLSGMIIDVVKTDSEGHAKRHVENLKELPDAILVAGGDGTLSETITGLMRRQFVNNNDKCPVGVLPLGRTNSVAKKIHKLHSNFKDDLEQVHGLAESTISVVRGKVVKKDVMKIQIIEDETKSIETDDALKIDELKPIFAMGSVQWGAYRDAQAFRDKYWYFGSFRDYVSPVFSALSNKLTWDHKAKLIYTPPCSGCSNCFINVKKDYVRSTGTWWSRFIPKLYTRKSIDSPLTIDQDYSKIIHENCAKVDETEINPVELILSVNDKEDNKPESIEVLVEDSIDSTLDFVFKSWKKISNNLMINTKEICEARTIKLIPEKISNDKDEAFYSIDSEAYEVKPIKVTLLPKTIELFTAS